MDWLIAFGYLFIGSFVLGIAIGDDFDIEDLGSCILILIFWPLFLFVNLGIMLRKRWNKDG